MPVLPDLKLQFHDGSAAPPVRAPFVWRGFSAEHVVLPDSDGFEFDRAGESHYLALHDIHVEAGEICLDGAPVADASLELRGAVAFFPAGCISSGWYKTNPRLNSFTALYFDPASIREELEDRYAAASLAPVVFTYSPQLAGTLNKLRGLLNAPDTDHLHAESVCLVAALEVLGVLRQPVGSRLPAKMMAQLSDFIDANLGRHINLTELAAVAGLSRFYFSKAFKKTTGSSPYDYVQARRVDMASRLLHAGDASIEVIAGLTGFRSTAQFRRVFKATTGATPQAFRQNRT